MLRLAHRDEVAFVALLASPGVPLAIALFHAQQAVEKALKSAMCLHGIEFFRTHDLDELVAQLVDAGHMPPAHGNGLQRLTPLTSPGVSVKFTGRWGSAPKEPETC